MFNNDRQEEEKLRMIARLLHTFMLTTALITLVTALVVIAWRFIRHLG